MKVITDTKPAFKPVTIILESQEEVRELFSLLVHGDLCNEETPLGGVWELLDGLAEGYEENFSALEARMKKAYPKVKK